MPQKHKNKRSQTVLKYYNQFRSVSIKTLRLLQIKTDTGNKIKIENEANEM